MKSTHHSLVGLSLTAVLSAGAYGAEITWGDSFSIAAPEDISNPAGSVVHEARDFNTAAGAGTGEDMTINVNGSFDIDTRDRFYDREIER